MSPALTIIIMLCGVCHTIKTISNHYMSEGLATESRYLVKIDPGPYTFVYIYQPLLS